jgi:hypothetical protein
LPSSWVKIFFVFGWNEYFFFENVKNCALLTPFWGFFMPKKNWQRLCNRKPMWILAAVHRSKD